MIKPQYRSGGQIKERQRSMGPKLPGSNAWDAPTSVPDALLAGLHTPLTRQQTQEIRELDQNGVPRSQIPRQLGLPKFRVLHELAEIHKNKRGVKPI
ncbi:hypothetical protein [Paenibacillus sp. 8b26]|uniref:hypothetical protein n=1 Tax=Paenibacillus sp. 8b26 TaxID=3424133 RepID=UPI003D64EA7F